MINHEHSKFNNLKPQGRVRRHKTPKTNDGHNIPLIETQNEFKKKQPNKDDLSSKKIQKH